MDARLINLFVNAIKNTFDTMVQTPLRVDRPCLSTDARFTYDVSAIIGLTGEVTGSVILSFPKQVAARVATAFGGFEITPEHPDFADAIGELVNIIAGSAKAKLDTANVGISLPTVIEGQHSINHPKASPRIVIPCECEHGPMSLEVTLKCSSAVTAASVDGETA